MKSDLSFTSDAERLEEGTPEERACFGAIGIQFGNTYLTEGYDGFVRRVRATPLLSGYHLAEWLAWNWWRLRWEPRSNTAGWDFSHRLTTIGEGYVWPNITIFSDGERIALIAKPTSEREGTAFRYISNVAAIVRARDFEYAIDEFIEQNIGVLHNEQIPETNLAKIWSDVRRERSDANLAKRRKFEALLGYDPDEVDAQVLENLVADGRELGEFAMGEIAADRSQIGEILSASTLRELANARGFEASLRSIVQLQNRYVLPRLGEVAAWRLGAEAARALREQVGLGDGRISNRKLAELAGVPESALTDTGLSSPSLSFALDEKAKSRVVLRSRWEAGRRFELARLLGDRLVAASNGKLFPATRAYTYRQKMQRSFAAEFLSPFDSLVALLAGDYSMESQQDAARHFQVSELTIRTLLVNHGRLEREDFDEELEGKAA